MPLLAVLLFSELAASASVIFMQAEWFIQWEGTFSALLMGAGQQMSLPLIHISCSDRNVSPVRHTPTMRSRRELKRLI